MKTIMIIDLPDGINVDKLCKTPVSLTFQLQSCKQTWHEDGYLRVMPEKREINIHHKLAVWDEDCDMVYSCGYNSCIEDILGETE